MHTVTQPELERSIDRMITEDDLGVRSAIWMLTGRTPTQCNKLTRAQMINIIVCKFRQDPEETLDYLVSYEFKHVNQLPE